MRPSLRHGLVVLVAGAALHVSGVAHATPEFPGIVQQVVGSSAPPACTICHNSETGGRGTVTTVFGMYLMSRGLVAYGDAALRAALSAAQAEKHDSNGDGVDDYDALKMGLDPNAGASGSASSPPAYGCGARVAGGGPGVSWLPITGFALAVGVLARRLRRR